MTIRHRSGTYDLDVKLAGYQPFRQKLTIQPGSAPPITIRLVPSLYFTCSGLESCRFRPPKRYPRGPIPAPASTPGAHCASGDEPLKQVSFRYVETDGLPVVFDISAREMTPLIASNFGPVTKIFSGAKAPVPVQMNGQKVGDRR